MDWAKTTARPDKKQLNFGIWCAYIKGFMVNVNYHTIFRHFQAVWCDVAMVIVSEPWWFYHMEMIPALLAICERNHSHLTKGQ